jgi:CDP-glucose 4,6-dehydratase
VSFWRHRSVLVTGVTGFLGAYVAEALVAKGALVVGLVRDTPSRSNRNFHRVAPSLMLVHGALEDGLLLERAVNEYEVDTVIHLGAQTIVGIANRNPLSTFEANIGGTWKLMEACRRSPKVERVVIASSDKAYGNLAREAPAREDLSLAGSHPYDVSKSCADLIAQAYHQTYGLPVAITRCGNFYGGGDLNWNRLFPGTIRSALEGERPIIRSNGRLVREYLYVRDAVTCYLTLAENVGRSEVQGQAFNFSTGQPMSVLDVTSRILQACGRADLSPDVQDLPEARHEIPYQALAVERARDVLGWASSWPMAGALQETVDWYREELKL